MNDKMNVPIIQIIQLPTERKATCTIYQYPFILEVLDGSKFEIRVQQ